MFIHNIFEHLAKVTRGAPVALCRIAITDHNCINPLCDTVVGAGMDRRFKPGFSGYMRDYNIDIIT